MTRLRQCLSYFFTVFSHSSHKNQRMIQTVTVPLLKNIVDLHQDYVSHMLTPLQIAQQVFDWIDPRKLVSVGREEGIDEGIHADVAIDLLVAVFKETNPAPRKEFCQFLAKLNLTRVAGERRIREMIELANQLIPTMASSKPMTLVLRRFVKKVEALDKVHRLTEAEYAQIVMRATRLRQQWRATAGADAAGDDEAEVEAEFIEDDDNEEPEEDADGGDEEEE
ncbi:nuclear condensing complex subunit, C-term domain-containing protein [Blyttiomyces helicus]|uniref:Nuclear condensing complex subunit, C-term domain-containing protein n=1 Tax=Blyttiomyces helicus TaxID=388810 RepID=A0A4P9WMS8_9FUNG|nr:nuclear condensing complex subunit, C-term domain-containing protein [Blyttiomyces helicus]|eukprot:RKO92988.1 nuclear condensing complex subunit, C-term domain-containing protein [Blyttiomyces helicus]